MRLGQHTGQTDYLDAAKKTLGNFIGVMEQMPAPAANMLLATGRYLKAAEQSADKSAGAQPDAVATKGPVTLEVFASTLAVEPGQTVDLVLRINIDKGWHINSNRPLQEDLIRTAVSLSTDAPATLTNVTYPPGREATFAFSPEAVSVYEAAISIHAKLAIPDDAAAGEMSLDLIVNTQACNDSSCLAPETHVLPLGFAVELPAAVQ